ncbi:HD domain-containing protein [Saccharothrix sp. NRRL B-16314]|uniref:HD domain-containing protein n=1 Tax=Saccharothrix sp. NRRL B-16314 TaxID=1463825 RepID=UPI0009DFD042|nr:HD domain-containing protein [Saccharothrix sp. NRRL B-16314]
MAWNLAWDTLGGSSPRRWLHVQGVGARASQAAPMLAPPEGVLLVAAALLHDIGYAPNVALTGFHPLDGARYLQTQGLPERLCALVAHHSCARMEAELRCLSVELAAWNDEKTELRDALWWADMTTTPDGRPTNVHDRIVEIERRYGPHDVVTTFIRQAVPELVGAVERTEERLRVAGLGHLAK